MSGIDGDKDKNAETDNILAEIKNPGSHNKKNVVPKLNLEPIINGRELFNPKVGVIKIL